MSVKLTFFVLLGVNSTFRFLFLNLLVNESARSDPTGPPGAGIKNEHDFRVRARVAAQILRPFSKSRPRRHPGPHTS